MAKLKSFGSEVNVNLRVPVDMPSRLAHHLSAQDHGEFVQLLFFEVIFPIIGGNTTDEELEAIQSAGLIGSCVSKINIPKSRYPDFVKAITTIAKASKEKEKERKDV